MLWKVSRILLFMVSWLQAGSYLSLQRKLALEMRVPQTSIDSFETWVRNQSAPCRDKIRFDEKRACLRKIMHEEGGIQFDSTSAQTPQDLLPQKLVIGKNGSCMSISFLVLILGEAIGVRGEPISLPGHVYVHFSTGTNWEPNREGFAYSDEEYRKKYGLDGDIGRIARALDLKEFEGLFRYEWANRLVAAKKDQDAMNQFLRAQTCWRDARIPGNRALLLESMGQRVAARKLLDSLWREGVPSEELVWNRALLMIRGSEALEVVLLFLDEAEGRLIRSDRLQRLRKRLQQELNL